MPPNKSINAGNITTGQCDSLVRNVKYLKKRQNIVIFEEIFISSSWLSHTFSILKRCSKVIFQQIHVITFPSYIKTQKPKKRKVASKFDRVFHLLELVKGKVASASFFRSLNHLRTGSAGLRRLRRKKKLDSNSPSFLWKSFSLLFVAWKRFQAITYTWNFQP